MLLESSQGLSSQGQIAVAKNHSCIMMNALSRVLYLAMRASRLRQAMQQISRRGQTSAAWPHCCSNNGTTPRMLTSAVSAFHQKADHMCGGCVTSVHWAFPTGGKPLSATGDLFSKQAVPTVLAEAYVPNHSGAHCRSAVEQQEHRQTRELHVRQRYQQAVAL